jgi:hypothetical protein
MRNVERLRITLTVLFVLLAGVAVAVAQNPELQQKIAEIKESAARNRQELAQYTWVEQVSIILKGEQKKQEHFQVRLGPDGKPQKTPLDAEASDSGGRKHGLKHHVVEKKKEEYKEYADQMKELLQQYVPPQKELLAQAAQQGNIALAPQPPSMAGGGPGEDVRLIISNYVKPGDKMTLVVNRETRELQSVNVASYLSDPKDAVKMDVQFAPIPGGPNHVSGATINGISKQLTITLQNSNYQKF